MCTYNRKVCAPTNMDSRRNVCMGEPGEGGGLGRAGCSWMV